MSNRLSEQGNIGDYKTTPFEKAVAQMHNRRKGLDPDANLLMLIAREGSYPTRYAKAHGGTLPKLNRPPCGVPGCPNMTMIRGLCSKHYECVRYRRQGWEVAAKYILPSSRVAKKGQKT